MSSFFSPSASSNFAHLPGRPTSRLAKLGRSAVALAVIGIVATGCDKKNDEKLAAELAKGSAQVSSGNSADAVTTLTPAAGAEAAAGVTLAAKYTLGHAKADLAAQSSTALGAVYLDIARLTSEIAQVGNSVSMGNTLVDGYRKQDPAEARARIRERIAEAQGGAGKDVWVDTGKNPIPTLAAAKQKLSAAQELVASKQSQIRSLVDKRKAALAEADELRSKVDGLKGREAVDAFARAASARKAVSLVSGEIETAEGELAILVAMQGVAEGQVTVVERYIAQLQAQDQAISTGFEQVGTQITNQIGVSKVAAEAPAEGDLAASIAAKATLLAAKYAEAEKLHAETEKLFTDAAAEYQGAFNEAGRLRAELQERIAAVRDRSPYSTAMLTSLQKTTSPTDFRQQQGVVITNLAELQALRAAMMASRENLVATLTPTMKTLGVEVPAALQGDLAAGTKSSRDAAAEAFTKAAAEFEGVAGGIQGSDADAARRRSATTMSQMFLFYAWSQFLTSTGDTAGAAEKLKTAIGYRDQLVAESKTKLPSLPGDLAVVAAAAEAPATAPAAP